MQSGDPNAIQILSAATTDTKENTVASAFEGTTLYGAAALARSLQDKSLVKLQSAEQAAKLNKGSKIEEVSLPTENGQTVSNQEGSTEPATEEAVTAGIPISILGQEMNFGGSIVAITETESEELGDLKLTDLPPLVVQPRLIVDKDKNYFVALHLCENQICDAAQATNPVLAFEVVGVNKEQSQLVVDLSAIGHSLDFSILGARSLNQLKLEITGSQTTRFDLSAGTFSFDIKSHIIPSQAAAAVSTIKNPFDVTMRWYFKDAGNLKKDFASRKGTAGVGFFETDIGGNHLIHRFDFSKKIHYYIKNVPSEFKAAFAGAFDSWNKTFNQVVGHEPLSYEFVDATDARAAQLVTGDIRYNIVEWDLVNNASYGGLGPSVAYQKTGETLSANVLIQGPGILDIYKKWFAATQPEANGGNTSTASASKQEHKKADFSRYLRKMHDRFSQFRSFNLALGKSAVAKNIRFRVPARLPQYRDQLMQRVDFEPFPANMTLNQYLSGYFHEMLSHELGHNFGLRHNFRGNLGAADDGHLGSVSRSVMEYLGKGFRFLNDIGEYDVMAMRYSYLGEKPAVTTWFCTDEDVASLGNATNSAECQKDDATSDPYGYFSSLLKKATAKLIATDSPRSPDWLAGDMKRELVAAFTGLGIYAVTGEKTFQSWTNFTLTSGRPNSGAQMRQFVLEEIYAAFHSAEVTRTLEMKETDADRANTVTNINDALAIMKQTLGKALTSDELALFTETAY